MGLLVPCDTRGAERLIAALFIIVSDSFKEWKQPRGSLTEHWFNKLEYTPNLGAGYQQGPERGGDS